mgnify:CR=1 FL=1
MEGRDERQADTFYAGKIWRGPVFPFSCGIDHGFSGAFPLFQKLGMGDTDSGSDYLYLLQDVFAKYPEKICGEPAFPE